MKNKKRIVWWMALIFVFMAILLASFLTSCNQKAVQEMNEKTEANEPAVMPVEDSRAYDLDPWTITVAEIEGCTYIFWNRGSGSDFEHHAGCKNPIHQKQHSEFVKNWMTEMLPDTLYAYEQW